MTYNLIDERWVPIQRRSGKVERVAPWVIAEAEDPPVRIESPRPDFDAALLELLIGLVQAVMTPPHEDDWEAFYESPPSAEDLRVRMNTVRDAFYLDGDGPRFFQDLTVQHDPRVRLEPVVGLLIDQGVADDSALFAKSGRFEELGYPAAAAAIVTLQSFAPSGGAGHCTSMRGGGPLSVTIRDSTLWKTVWCNVLNGADLASVPGNPGRTARAATFPWLAETRTSEQGQPATFPEHVHPLQHYFGLPRRFRFDVDAGTKGTCAVYGDAAVPVIRAYFSRPSGTSYDGAFLHPLTPYTELKEGQPPNPKKGGSGVAYRDWPLLTIGGPKLIPPRVVEAFHKNGRWRVARTARVAARGYAMDNMKPLRFIEADAPMFPVEPRLLAPLRADACGLVEASEAVRRSLASKVKEAWSAPPGDVDARTQSAFWSATEADFYRAVRAIAEALSSSADGDSVRASAKTTFLDALAKAALRVFDDICPTNADLGADDLARVVQARKHLARAVSSDMHLATVGLAEPEKKDSRTKRTRKSRRE